MKLKYIKSADEEYILDDGENINDLGKCSLKDAKNAAEKAVNQHYDLKYFQVRYIPEFSIIYQLIHLIA